MACQRVNCQIQKCTKYYSELQKNFQLEGNTQFFFKKKKSLWLTEMQVKGLTIFNSTKCVQVNSIYTIHITLFYRHIIKKNPLRGFLNNVFSRRFSYFFFQILKPLELHLRFKRSPFSSTNSCVINCTDQPIKPICGDDSVTYPNHCELEKATKCLGKSVRFQHEGECTSGML